MLPQLDYAHVCVELRPKLQMEWMVRTWSRWWDVWDPSVEQQPREWMENRLQDVWEDCVRAFVELHVKLQEWKEKMESKLLGV